MNKKQKALMVFVPAILIIILLIVIAAPSYLRAHKQSQRNACLNNLSIIDAATGSAALTLDLHKGDPVPQEELLKFMKGYVVPVCPSGGRYNLPPAGEPPSCSYHGNLMKEAGALDIQFKR